jgi:hypothetical protein
VTSGTPGRHEFAGFHVALVDLRGQWRVDDHLIDDRLDGLDVGERLADIRSRDLTFLFGVPVDDLFVGRLGLIHSALSFMQAIGRLIESRLRGIASFGQLSNALVGLLR